MANRITDENIQAIGAVLNSKTRPLKERFRALFTLKNIGGPIALECIKSCFSDDSALLKHELAYCMGQMQDVNAIPTLVSVLEDKDQESMVRHEAAEALGAIGSQSPVPILEKFVTDSSPEVAETCQIALDRLKLIKENGPITNTNNLYTSVDPAPPATIDDIDTLKAILLDENTSLFERYRAMFALRNLVSKSAVEALGAGLKAGKSALFRHEVAFVLGQLQRLEGVAFLKERLEDKTENEMVRHECAEALGAIATNECLTILDVYLNDDKRVVKESCEVALDMCDYENNPEFQYANTLSQVQT